MAAWMLLAIPLLAPGVEGAVLDEVSWRAIMPDATAIEAASGSPPAMAAYREGQLIGYLVSTSQAIDARGYSGKPLDVLVGIGLDGVITGARILAQQEPILVTGVAPADLDAFAAGFKGVDLRRVVQVQRVVEQPDGIAAISGATVSSVVIGDAIMRAARAVASSRGLLGATAGALDLEGGPPGSWAELLAEGSLARLSINVGEATAAVRAAGGQLYAPGAEPSAEAPFIDLYAGLATPARIGKSLLGDTLYNRLLAELPPDGQLIFLGAAGAYSFKGTAWVKSGWFDRVQLVQGARTLRLAKDMHLRIEELALADAPALRELAIFRLAPDRGFVPIEPWQIDLMVQGRAADATAVAQYALPYQLPARYLRRTDAGSATLPLSAPLWPAIWQARTGDITILATALLLLSSILVFQEGIVRRPKLHQRLRLGFLLFVLLWLGWYASAQLSVLHVLTFATALRTGFDWGFFLLEPLIFILWSYVAVALIFWGRGVFCGWLCPFGALQELTHAAAQRLGLPQLRIPFGLHERLWPIKFILFLGLCALSLGPLATALELAEIEPFKTAIVLRFDRTWPHLAYAGALLLAGLFVERAFCRYLCPLGAAFALPSRLRQFEWLKRHWQCGRQCQICAVRCPVQAIHPDGRINPGECIHCLACQVTYLDDRACPVQIERRKRRRQRAATGA